MSQSWAVLRENDSTGSKEVDEEVRSFGDQINQLEQVYSEGLKTLTDVSNNLIQLVSTHYSSVGNTGLLVTGI